jgi:hypothetical protein
VSYARVRTRERKRGREGERKKGEVEKGEGREVPLFS